jgi:hypothetical protein
MRTDKHNKANSCFSQLNETPKNKYCCIQFKFKCLSIHLKPKTLKYQYVTFFNAYSQTGTLVSELMAINAHAIFRLKVLTGSPS